MQCNIIFALKLGNLHFWWAEGWGGTLGSKWWMSHSDKIKTLLNKFTINDE